MSTNRSRRSPTDRRNAAVRRARLVALDTDVLVNWTLGAAPFHEQARRLIRREVRKGGRLGIVPQVVHEFVHVVTDARRLDEPLTMAAAVKRSRELWNARETVRVLPGPAVMARTLELLQTLSLGRKRILDTALAATLEAAGVDRLATLNPKDYRIFSFLQIVEPG